jgi:hypothetical protein
MLRKDGKFKAPFWVERQGMVVRVTSQGEGFGDPNAEAEWLA